MTVYMCWHGGHGHDYPSDVMQAATRLRSGHTDAAMDDEYTSLTFEPTDDDVRDFILVGPYCDLAYASDASGEVLAEITGEEG